MERAARPGTAPDEAVASGPSPTEALASGPVPSADRRLRPPTPRAALTILAGLVLALVFFAAAPAVKPFVLGVVLVYLLAPLVERLAGIGVPRPLAVLLTFALVLAVLAGVAALALTPLIQQLREFVTELPAILADARSAVDELYDSLGLTPEVRTFLDDAAAAALASLESLDLGGIVAPLVTSLVSVIGTIIAYAILPAWLFFLLKDLRRLGAALERSLPPSWREDIFAGFAIANRVFGNWIRGQLVLGVTVGLASYAGLIALSVLVDPVFGRFAVLLALVAGILELVPFIGPIIAAVPAVLIGLTAGPGGLLAALLLYLLIQQLENNVLVPKIQGDAVELHPSAVMLALVIGASLGGVLGAIVSLPIAAALRDLFRYGFRRLSDPPATPAEALAAVSSRLVPASRDTRDAAGGAGSHGAPATNVPA